MARESEYSDVVSRMFPAEDKSIVVILEPTLMYWPPERRKSILPTRVRGNRSIAATFVLNDKMCTWITWFGQQYSIPIHVWSFLPLDLFDLLTPRIEVICGNYIHEWTTFNTEREARARHRTDMGILTVYDSDADRVDRLWQMRGQRVAIGGTP